MISEITNKERIYPTAANTSTQTLFTIEEIESYNENKWMGRQKCPTSRDWAVQPRNRRQ